MGSLNVETGLKTQSELSPVACSVLEPSKPHIGGSVPCSIIFVLLLNLLVGVLPSIHIYSAFIFILINVVLIFNIWNFQILIFCFKIMVNGYINLDKEHSDFLSIFENIGVKKLSLKKLKSQNEVDIVLTSLSKYGETKKNLSDIETSSKPLPALIIANNKEFDQAVDLISNDRIEVVSSNSRVSEVNARINSLLGDSSAEKLEFKDLVINLKTYEAIIDSVLLDLTFMEYELLKFFIENQDNVWSREELLEKVWGYDYFGGARTVDVHVRRLRSKLGEKRLDWIKTVHSVGYKFN